jgi:hypothetical protein
VIPNSHDLGPLNCNGNETFANASADSRLLVLRCCIERGASQ